MHQLETATIKYLDDAEAAILLRRRNPLGAQRASQYSRFLTEKRARVVPVGLTGVNEEDLCPSLFDWQKLVVAWKLRHGRTAAFADCGLGKSIMQLSRADYLHRRTNGNVLILTPLSVADQTRREGERFGIPVTVVRHQNDVRPGINVANYERLPHLDTSLFNNIELDESSILKNFTGQIKQNLCDAFEGTPYRAAWTATPAPNDFLELGNHAAFLGIMPANEMIMRWFINDAAQAGNYRLKEHARSDFWRWITSWAVTITKPSDLGAQFSDEGYDLPPLNITTHVVNTRDEEIWNVDGTPTPKAVSMSATTMHQIMRLSAEARAAKVAEIVARTNGDGEPWVVWCNTDYEADALMLAIPGAVEVRGSHKTDYKEETLAAFAAGQIRVLVTKPKIAGFGLNWQHCRRMAFVGLSYSYEQFYQSARRCWRYGQNRPVECHIVHAEAEGDVLKTIERKRADHEIMKSEMAAAAREADFSAAQSSTSSRKLITVLPRRIVRGNAWEMRLGDSCELIRNLASSSVQLTVTSPPFANLYIYSEHEADMGNCVNQEEFFTHFRFLIEELLRVTVPGRLCAIHCKDLPKYKGRDGAMGLIDFPGAIRAAFESVPGWVFHSRVTIWKDPVTEMQRTKNHGLLYKELCKDSAGSRQGMADYLLVFRRWDGVEDGKGFPDPVTVNGERFDSYIGQDPPNAEFIAERCGVPVPSRDAAGRWPSRNPFPSWSEAYRVWSIAVWQRYASPVWMDINQMRVLNGRIARDSQDEKHICPLQLDVIERCIALWSNESDLILDPFMGVGSTAVGALSLMRRALGLELKPSYFDYGVGNLRQIEEANRNLFTGAK